MARFFTSDTHFQHNMVITAMKRGKGRWSNIDDHDKELIDNINRLVGVKDELYILGDFAWVHPRKIRPRIHCRHIKVVLGNHDKWGHLREVFGEAPDTRMIKSIGDRGMSLFMSHYPHAFWPQSHYGSYHIYGHMHAQREATLDRWMPDRRSMDVGVDNAARLLGEHRPFTEGEILHFMDRAGHDPLSFYRSDEERRQAITAAVEKVLKDADAP